MYACLVRVFLLARYDILFLLLRANQNLVLCARLPNSTGVQNISINKRHPFLPCVDHGADSEAMPTYRLRVLHPFASKEAPTDVVGWLWGEVRSRTSLMITEI